MLPPRICPIDHSPEKVLKWSDRLGILVGIAKAVHFLHTGIIPGFFNNRLRTHNILLDEHCIAKVSDYGLSIISEEIYRLEVGTSIYVQSCYSFQTLFPSSCNLLVSIVLFYYVVLSYYQAEAEDQQAFQDKWPTL